MGWTTPRYALPPCMAAGQVSTMLRKRFSRRFLLLLAGIGMWPCILGTAAVARDFSTPWPHADARQLAVAEATAIFANGFEHAAEPGDDTIAPSLAIDEPVPGALLTSTQPTFRVSYADVGSGVDTDTLVFRSGQTPVSVSCAHGAAGAVCQPLAALPQGVASLTARIADLAGNTTTTAPTVFSVDSVPPQALLAEDVDQGPIVSGSIPLQIAQSAVEAGASIRVIAPALATPLDLEPQDGMFVAQVPLQPGDTITLRVRDAASNESAPLYLTPGLPPDPVGTAPPLSDSGAGDFIEPIEFLYEEPDPVQIGVLPGAIEPARALVLRGNVFDGDGAPLAGVRITHKDAPQLGYTLSRADGAFDFVANGGGRVVLEYRKSGYLPAQRQTDAPWNDYVVMPDAALVALDPHVTPIELGAADGQIALGGENSDANGERRASVYFPPGLQAQMYDADGQLQPLDALDVRFTEYTVGDDGPRRMPSPLPPTTAYTYAVEISVDQALANGRKVAGRDVVFDRPVALHVDNFLDYPVGEGVPTGYYDTDAVAWKAVPDGRIIALLSVSGGLAVLDIEGNGVAATPQQLAALGIDEDERALLAQRFAPGASFWRVQLTHFSTWDCNWPFGPPDDAIPPDFDVKKDDGELENDCKMKGCEIGARTQTLHEKVAVPGLPGSTIGYSSNNAGLVIENGPALKLRLTPADLPESFKRVELEVHFLGRVLKNRYAGTPNQRVRIPLVLIDPYYRQREGTYPIKIRIGYVYKPTIRSSSQGGGGGGGGFGSSGFAGMISGDRERTEITLWDEWSDSLTFASAQRTRKTGAWRLPFQHVLEPQSGTLYLGGGRRVDASERPSVIRTLAGGFAAGSAPEDVPAIGAHLRNPGGIAYDALGRLYIADTDNHRIRRVDADGRIRTVAGSGAPGGGGDGGPATSAQLDAPSDVSIGPDGTLYIADTGNHRIRAVLADGRITTVAGTGVAGSTADGAPGTASRLHTPRGVAADAFGYLFIADTGNQRVRALRPDASLVTWAGGGNGDGDRALDAVLSTPIDVATDGYGTVYIAEAGAHRVRAVRQDGAILHVAGTGATPFNGDGLVATQANLAVSAIGVDRSGRLLITDAVNHRLRRVDPNGRIATVAGNGANAYAADGGIATKAGLQAPRGVAVDPADQIVFVHANAVRHVARAFARTAGENDIVLPDPGGDQLHVFARDGRHLRTLDALTGGVLYSLQYNSGAVVSMTDAYGNITRVERDGGGQPTAIVSADGLRTELTLDSRGVISGIETPAGHATTFGYDGDGLLLSMRNARNHVWTYTYDQGRLATDDRPDGSSWTIARRDGGAWHEVDFTTRLGRTTTHRQAYLPDGNDERSTVYPDDTFDLRRYSPAGDEYALTRVGTTITTTMQPDPRFGALVLHPARIDVTTPGGLTSTLESTLAVTPPGATDPSQLTQWQQTTTVNGRASVQTYTQATRTFTHTTPAGRSAAMTVDAQRRPTHMAMPGLADIAYSYDSRGRLDAVTQSDGDTVREYTFGYDANGYLATVTDPLQRSVTISNDLDGRPTQITLPDQRIVDLVTDPNGNVTALTTPKDDTHTFAYDPIDRETRYEAPAIGPTPTVTDTDYDLDGNPEQQRLPGGIDLNIGYDAGGRVTSISRPEQAGDADSDVELAYAYDGSLTTGETVTGAIAGHVGYGYDNDFRLRTVTVAETPPAPASVAASSKDAAKAGAPPASTVTYDYDADSLLTSATSIPAPGLGVPATLAMSRDPQHGLLTGTTSGVVTDAWTWNAYAEPVAYTASVNGSPLLAFAYKRDALGRITRKTETLEGVTTVTDYTYDLAGRLESVTVDGALFETYGYDANGNRTSVTPGQGEPVLATYDAQDRILTHGNCSFTHTANGELASKTCGTETTRYTYNIFGDLTAVELPDGTQIEYIVDGRGRRTGKRVNGELVQGFLYLNQLEPVAELDGQGNIVATYSYAERGNTPSFMHKDGETHRIVADHLGSPRLLINLGNGALTQSLRYDEWGSVVGKVGPDVQPFGFAGGIRDPDTDLMLFGARDYSSQVGRWASKEPLGFAITLNWYEYARGDPVRFVDVDGRAPDLPPPFVQKPIPISPGGPVGIGSPITRTPQRALPFARKFLESKMTTLLTSNLLDIDAKGNVTAAASARAFAWSLLFVTDDLGCSDFDCNPRDGWDDRWISETSLPQGGTCPVNP